MESLPDRYENRLVAYLAYFGSQTNLEALEWYLKEVHPLLKQKINGYKFAVIGAGNIDSVKHLFDECVLYIGPFDDLPSNLLDVTVGIAPILCGGGFRGKINQYNYFYIPTITHSAVIRGLPYQHKKNILTADSAQEYVDCISQLLSDKEFYSKIATSGNNVAVKNYVWDNSFQKIKNLYSLPEKVAHKPISPLVSIIVPSYNHVKYINQRIKSIYDQTYKNFECIVIDDCSSDGTAEKLSELQSLYNFKLILKTSNSGSAFGSWQSALDECNGELIWICESDDYAADDFLDTAVQYFCSDQNACLFYSASNVVDENNNVIATTHVYHQDVWNTERWNSSFVNNGQKELFNYQLKGQTVPNMSSSLMSKQAFKASLSSDIVNYKLAGDWLLMGLVMKHGNVCYCSRPLSFFRKHDQTCRSSTSLARSVAEYMLVKYNFMKSMHLASHDLEHLQNFILPELYWAIHENADFIDVVKYINIVVGDVRKSNFIIESYFRVILEGRNNLLDIVERYRNLNFGIRVS